MTNAHRRLYLLSASVLLALAASCEPAPQPDGRSPDSADEASKATDAFFAKDTFYYVRLQGWREDLMTPEQLTDFQQVPGSQVRVFEADPESKLHCPDAEVDEGNDVVFETGDFKIRTSGNLTKNTPKSSYKIKFTEKQSRMFGMEAINLKSMWNDVSQMREALAWRLFNEIGVPSARHTYAKFCIKDRYYGLYSVIEDVGKAFLERHFGENDDGNLYKVFFRDLGPGNLTHRVGAGGDDSGKQYFTSKDPENRTYELQTNDKSDDDPALQTYDDLAELIRVINGIDLPGGDERFDTDAYRDSVEAVFNARAFLRWASLNVLLGAWDNYYGTPANYYLYNSGKAGDKDGFMQRPYFTFIPHDYDNTWGIDFFDVAWQFGDIIDWESTTLGYHDDGTTSQLPLIRNMLKNEDFRAYYLDHLEFLLDELFTEKVIMGRIGQEGSGGLWDKVRQPAFLEADGPALPAHTGRQFTFDQVFFNGFKHNQLQNGQQFILGILHYIRMRHDAALGQLADLRKSMPEGQSGATFPAKHEPLPD